MVLVQGRRRHHLLFALALVAACGGEGSEVKVNVSVPEGESVFATVTQVELDVVHEDRRIGQTVTAYQSGEALSIGKLPHDNDMTIYLVGRDSDGDAVVYGEATTGTLSDSGDCCVTLCMCTGALYASNSCTCGANGCGGCEAKAVTPTAPTAKQSLAPDAHSR